MVEPRELTQEELRSRLDYDPETGMFIRKVTTAHNARVGDVAGSRTAIGYVEIGVLSTRWYAHRLAWLYVHGELPAEEIDHINGDRADNRISNLRQATHAQNLRNCKCPKTNTSGFKGVTWDQSHRQWMAQIKKMGKRIHLGRFKTRREAYAAYCRAADKHHGEFANHGRVDHV